LHERIDVVQDLLTSLVENGQSRCEERSGFGRSFDLESQSCSIIDSKPEMIHASWPVDRSFNQRRKGDLPGLIQCSVGLPFGNGDDVGSRFCAWTVYLRRATYRS